ncbi:tRNA pseudouridine(38-40) synthase TruA [Wolbachia endosymbiont of Howardula sp.]|uniref:tRNA pseudouridine(38-40) synthase TruA n=1 Tax=Wolbachia endosymbiont of Howardula sp. TaxID=2916816 RepID=UPI00217E0586|nr:tRNA pseudouridine(38-40) synthase TruA [Wolbachia endosymbiont of Howardula sp.]UWI83322.1 tRNA pseudouridine(38-40) synthase TruA [Wolbachia endosymbiont of Howardula sp.]
MRYKLIIEYNGYSFSGWQKQKQSSNSIQAAIENAIFLFTGTRVELYCSGRTDAGVHAIGQVAHCDLEVEYTLETIRNALNFYLKSIPIVILNVSIVDNTFHARFSAKKRYYEYRIINRDVRIVLGSGYAWYVMEPINIDIMNRAAQYLIGQNNLSSFRSKDCQVRNPIKTIDSINIVKKIDHIYITISAISFLYKQVRIIVGTLIDFGKRNTNPHEMFNIITQCKRSAAGMTAPPYGLYLVKIDY